MGTTTIGSETLERLARLDTSGHPILSLYLDLDPQRFPTPRARNVELNALLSRARREASVADVDLAESLLRSEHNLLRDGLAIAVFCSAAAGVGETVRMGAPAGPLVVVDTMPWLEPLAAAVAPGSWGVAVLSRDAARLMRGSASDLAELAVLHSDVHKRHAQGGWSQSRFQRGIEEHVAAHVRAVCERMLRAHRRKPFEHLALIAAAEMRPLVLRSLPAELAAILAGTIDADLLHASTGAIVRAIAPLAEQAECEDEHRLVTRLEADLACGGLAAAGLDEVLETLVQDRVETLLISDGPSLPAGLCCVCGRLWTDHERRCPLDGTALSDVDAVEHVVDEAARQAATVLVVRHELDWLSGHGGIAARLRW